MAYIFDHLPQAVALTLVVVAVLGFLIELVANVFTGRVLDPAIAAQLNTLLNIAIGIAVGAGGTIAVLKAQNKV